ncbi:MAG: hypothetical protein HQ456_03535 [Polynucleobacter sp.]|nr:hypothetical protein [Polynucleobacter sp.]
MRGKSQASLLLIEASHQILEEIEPASVRAVCYRLFTMGIIPNMSKGSTGKVSKQLVYARENGIIPWEWIVDETRAAEKVATWKDTDQRIAVAVRNYRRDYWQEQPYRIEIWSEKGTVRGTLAPILDEYGVTFRAMHGYSSATVINTIAEESNAGSKPLIAFYCGDFDPSGKHMSDIDLPDRLERYGAKITIERIALLESDVFGGDLPSFKADTKTGDSRYQWFVKNFGHNCWELDAMSPVTLRERVEDSILFKLDLEAWYRAIDIEEVEKASMREFHQSWKNTQIANRG